MKTPKRNLEDIPKTFLEHIDELRTRILYLVCVLIFFTLLGFYFYDYLLKIVVTPVNQTLYYTAPSGGLQFQLELCITFGIILTIPFIILQALLYVQPLFKNLTLSQILAYLLSSSLLIVLGTCFAYFVCVPSSLYFLNSFNTVEIKSLITAQEYLSFLILFVVGCNLVFQMPVVFFLLEKIKPLNLKKLFLHQRLLILFSFIFAAVLTPTYDPVNQLFIALPIILLYNLSLLLIFLKRRFKNILGI